MESLWQKSTDIPSFPRLCGDISADVLVIGGGIAGLLIAHRLKETGIEAVLVEKGRLCHGTTAGTTAKITAQHGLIYHKLLQNCGREQAQMYYRANAAAGEALKQLCRKADCSLQSKDNYVYTSDPHKLEAEMLALQTLDIPAKCTDQLPLPVTTAGAVGFADQGQFHPLQLAKYLTKGLKIYENTKVTELIGTTAVTESGRIKAKKVVVATHFPFINKHGSYFLKLYQHRSYVLALEDAPVLDGMYVEDSKSGLSFSSFDGFLLLGGGGHRTGKQGGSYPALHAFKDQHYPNERERFSWAVQDTVSLDGIPYIGHYSRRTSDLYVATGFNKWGMTGSMVSAEIISSMIAGRESDYAPVFSPSRSILKPQLFANGLESVTNLLIPTTRRCPHLGCALHYNKEERSWDCSCHGSRFSASGKVLNNPANGDLKKK